MYEQTITKQTAHINHRHSKKKNKTKKNQKKNKKKKRSASEYNRLGTVSGKSTGGGEEAIT